MKALLVIAFLIMIISANQQFSSQYFPQHYRDIIYELKKLVSTSKESIQIFSSKFNHHSISKSLQKAARKGVHITIIIPKKQLNTSIRELALYQNIRIMLSTDIAINEIQTLCLFDERTAFKCTLPLDETFLKDQKGKAIVEKEIKSTDNTHTLLKDLSKKTTNYFLD